MAINLKNSVTGTGLNLVTNPILKSSATNPVNIGVKTPVNQYKTEDPRYSNKTQVNTQVKTPVQTTSPMSVNPKYQTNQTTAPVQTNTNQSRFIGFQNNFGVQNQFTQPTDQLVQQNIQKAIDKQSKKEKLYIPTQAEKIKKDNSTKANNYIQQMKVIQDFQADVYKNNGQMTEDMVRRLYPEFANNIPKAMELQKALYPIVVQNGEYVDEMQIRKYFPELIQDPQLTSYNSKQLELNSKLLNAGLTAGKKKFTRLLEEDGDVLTSQGQQYLQSLIDLTNVASEYRKNYKIQGNPTDADILLYAMQNDENVKNLVQQAQALELTELDKATINRSSDSNIINLLSDYQKSLRTASNEYQRNIQNPINQGIESGLNALEEQGVGTQTPRVLSSIVKTPVNMVGGILGGQNKLTTATDRLLLGQEENAGQVVTDLFKAGAGGLETYFNVGMPLATAMYYTVTNTKEGEVANEWTLGLFNEGIDNILSGKEGVGAINGLKLSQDNPIVQWYNSLDEETKADVQLDITTAALRRFHKSTKADRDYIGLRVNAAKDATVNAFQRGKGGALFQAWVEKGLADENGKFQPGAVKRIVREGISEFSDALKENFSRFNEVVKAREEARGFKTAPVDNNNLEDQRSTTEKVKSEIKNTAEAVKNKVSEVNDIVKEKYTNLISNKKGTQVKGVQQSESTSENNKGLNQPNYTQGNNEIKTKSLLKPQVEFLQSNNKMNPKAIQTFEEKFGESYGQYMYDKGFTKKGESNLEDMATYQKDLMQIKEDALNKIDGKFNDVAVQDMLEVLQDFYTKTKDRKNLDMVENYINQHNNGGLTMPEINKVRKKFQYDIRTNFFKDGNSEKIQLANNVYLAVKDFLDKTAKENGLDSLDEINREIMKVQHIIGGITYKLRGSSANNMLGLTDWISLASMVNNPQAIALFLGKQLAKKERFMNPILKIAVGGRGNAKNRITAEKMQGQLNNIAKINNEKARNKELEKFYNTYIKPVKELSEYFDNSVAEFKKQFNEMVEEGTLDNALPDLREEAVKSGKKNLVTSKNQVTIEVDEKGNARRKGQISESDKRSEDNKKGGYDKSEPEPKNKVTKKEPKPKKADTTKKVDINNIKNISDLRNNLESKTVADNRVDYGYINGKYYEIMETPSQYHIVEGDKPSDIRHADNGVAIGGQYVNTINGLKAFIEGKNNIEVIRADRIEESKPETKPAEKKFTYDEYGEITNKIEEVQKEINKKLDKQYEEERSELLERFNELKDKTDKTDAEGAELAKLADKLNNQMNKYDRLKEEELKKQAPELLKQKEELQQAFDRDWKKAMDAKKTGLAEKLNNTAIDTNSSDFKEWFGDYEKDPKNASKVVDKEGKPMMVYHGTPRKEYINVFDKNRAGKTQSADFKGIFFTDEKGIADVFSHEQLPGSSSFWVKLGEKGRVYSSYLNMRNPLDFNQKITKEFAEELYNYRKIEPQYGGGVLDYYPGAEGKEKFINQVMNSHPQSIKFLLDMDKVEKAGYDGYIAKMYGGDTPGNEYVVWDGNQIITDNTEAIEKPKNTDDIEALDNRKDIVSEYKEKTNEMYQSIDGETPAEVEAEARDYIIDRLNDVGIYDDDAIVDLAVTGSRSRGLARPDSDLDIVVEINDDLGMREDDLFDILNEDSSENGRLRINGIDVDINPIIKSKSGTIGEYLEKAEKYLSDKKDKQDTKNTLNSVTGGNNAVTAKQTDIKPKNLVTEKTKQESNTQTIKIQDVDKDTYYNDIMKNPKDHPREMFIYKDGNYYYPSYILPSGKILTPENTYWGEVSSEEAARNWLQKKAEEHSVENETKKTERLKNMVGKTAEKYEETLKRIESDNPMQEIRTRGDYFKYGTSNSQMAKAKKEADANAEVGTFKKDVIDGKEGYRIFVSGSKQDAIRAFYEPKTGKAYRIYRGPTISDAKPFTTREVDRIEKFLGNVEKQLEKETKKEKVEKKDVITQEWLDSIKPDKDGVIELEPKSNELYALRQGKESLVKEGKADGKYLQNYGGEKYPQYIAVYIKDGNVYEGRRGLEDQFMKTKQEAVDWLNQKEKDVEHEATARYTQTDYEPLPKTISVESEAEKAGPKRIAPDRVKWQQETYDKGLNNVKDVLKASPLKLYELGFKSDRSKAVQDIMSERKRIRELPEEIAEKQWNELAKSVYEPLVIKDISKGYRYPEDVTSKFPKAQMQKAIDARARYEKGLFTSFSNKDTRANNQYRDEIGAGIKSQDGKPVTQEQMNEIVDGIRSFGGVFGLDMKKFAEDNNIIYVHLHGGNPFLMGGGGKSKGGGMNIAGLYRRGSDGNISISLGGVELVMEKGEDGEMKKNNVNATPEHELAHAFDYMLDNKLFSSQDIEILKKTMNKPTRLIKYYNKSQEIVARAVEQYAAKKTGKSRYGRPYKDSQAYWNEENFEKYVKPIVEKNMNEKLKEYKLDNSKKNVISNDKNRVTSK